MDEHMQKKRLLIDRGGNSGPKREVVAPLATGMDAA